MDRRKILLVVAVVVAAIGAGLVFVYANGAEDRAAEKLQTVPVLVAQQEILPGESAADAANAGKLLSEQVPASEVLQGSTNDGAVFENTIALTTIYPGEQLVTQKFGTIDDVESTTLPIPEGKTAITLQLTDAGRVGSFTQPGSHVVVYFTPAIPESAQPDLPDNAALIVPACVLEEDLLVLGVGSRTVQQAPPADGEETPAPTDTVAVTLLTVAVDSEQASSLIGFQTASDSGSSAKVTLTFALRSPTSVVRNTQVCADYLKALDQQLELAAPSRPKTNG